MRRTEYRPGKPAFPAEDWQAVASFLRKAYLEDRHTLRQIAEELGVSIHWVGKQLKKLRIEVRKQSHYTHDAQKINKLHDRNYLLHEYVELRRTTNNIAYDLDVTNAAVKYALRKFGIRARKRGEYTCEPESLARLQDKSFLESEYLEKKKSIYEIAAGLQVDGSTVRRYLEKYNILRREAGVAHHPHREEAYRLLRNKEYLTKEYVEKGKAAYIIAWEIGVDPSTVCDHLHKYGITVKTALECNGVSGLHQHHLVPLLKKHNIKHHTSYILRENDKMVYEMDEYLPELKVFIELQGLYWHGYTKKNEMSARKVRGDIKKWKYVTKHYPDHKIVYVLESDFEDGLAERIIVSLDKNTVTRSEWKAACYRVAVGKCTAQVEEFVKQHHYLGNVPAHKYLFSAYHKNELVAVCVFSHPSRHEQVEKYGPNVLELSRYCSAEHGTNLNSWFLSKCLKQIKERPIVTYADITRYPGKLSHDGGIYKAANFRYTGLTHENYRYLTIDGRLLHKRAVWQRAQKNGLSEDQEAKQEFLTKWYEWPKKVYLYEEGT